MIPVALVFGKGPGPKNVLIDRGDGKRIVLTYRTWKQLQRGEIEIVQGELRARAREEV